MNGDSAPAAMWAQLAAPLPREAISWRQDGKPKQRQDGTWAARFVAYVDAGTVRERLDQVCPGDWSLELELLPPVTADSNGVVNDQPYAFKTTLSVCGVRRQDVGVGKDYKQASTDSFKRAAVRFGIGHELYEMPQLWVPMDSGDRGARPLQSPEEMYARMLGKGTPAVARRAPAAEESSPAPAASVSLAGPRCPECSGPMTDERLTKKNPRAPDYRCRDGRCKGLIWPDKSAA